MAVGQIRKAAVLGSGVMGTGIAAHLANAGIPTLLLDIVPKGVDKNAPAEARNAIAIKSLEAGKKAKPAAFMSPRFQRLVTVGNFEDDLARIADCDWVIEVIIENMAIKKDLLKKVAAHWKPGMIVTSNTSGLSINGMIEGLPKEFRQHFLGTHFFNPPRYMKLLEVIPSKDTTDEVLEAMRRFCAKTLGKGVVDAKDTPNFIANRIGIYGISRTLTYMEKYGLTVEEVDMITGAPMAHPKSATFRTADLVGLDTMYHVSKNIYEAVTSDPDREHLKPAEFLRVMVEEKKWLGDKTGNGFYKKSKGPDGSKTTLQLDLKTMEYVPSVKPRFDSVGAVRKVEEPGDRVKGMFAGTDKAADFAWEILRDTFLYSIKRIPEICDSPHEIDRAMCWGFGWDLGPFQAVDAIGLGAVVERMKKEGVALPAALTAMLAKKATGFYKEDKKGAKSCWSFAAKAYKPIAEDPQVHVLPRIRKDAKRIVAENSDASLIDLGDKVLNLQFHCKMNAVGADMVMMINQGVDLLESSGDWLGMTVANHDSAFSAGANLFMVLVAAQSGELKQVEQMSAELQNALMRMKYCSKPVVTAPAGLALGGGCEIAMHGQRVVAAGETYIGLVEFGVGLVPAGGGCKEMAIRMTEGIPMGVNVDLLQFIGKGFENVAMAKVATSGEEARDMGFFRASDQVVLSRDHQIEAAKRMALAMAYTGHKPGRPRDDIPVAGTTGKAALMLMADGMKRGGFISDHDMLIAGKVAHIICGGNVPAGTLVSEQNLLDLEREAFMSLLGTEKTLARIQHMLTSGKPLRN